MNYIQVKAGDVVVTQFGIYQHWSIVSDKLCALGNNMLISETKRTGTVREETWEAVTRGENTYVAVCETEKTVEAILLDARSQIGKWTYSLTDRNCEHFVKWSSGVKISSSQVKALIGGTALGSAAIATIAEKPTFAKILGGGLLIGGIALLLSKASSQDS